jgi:hypothetical protein
LRLFLCRKKCGNKLAWSHVSKLNDGYKVELDVFSGQPNPAFEIRKDEFESILNRIRKQRELNDARLFDGLGFRGIILSGRDSDAVIQKNVIRVRSSSGVRYFESNADIISKAFDLFKTHDEHGKYLGLVGKLMEECL